MDKLLIFYTGLDANNNPKLEFLNERDFYDDYKKHMNKKSDLLSSMADISLDGIVDFNYLRIWNSDGEIINFYGANFQERGDLFEIVYVNNETSYVVIPDRDSFGKCLVVFKNENVDERVYENFFNRDTIVDYPLDWSGSVLYNSIEQKHLTIFYENFTENCVYPTLLDYSAGYRGWGLIRLSIYYYNNLPTIITC